MSTPEMVDNAEVVAKLEVGFDRIAELTERSTLADFGLPGYELLNPRKFTRETGEVYPKAITIKAPDGSIFIHYRGTGDGNWGYNAAAYGGPPSPMQDWSLDYFNEMVETYYDFESGKSLNVTGHSQGGNNAQFVTIRSPYGDQITNCISLDGPGFSTQFREDSINLYGEAYFDRQRGKIYAFNGVNDYVSCLGQLSIVPDGHTEFVSYNDHNDNGIDFAMYHEALGLLTDTDLSKTGLLKLADDESDFRRLLRSALVKLGDLPPEKQLQSAELIMLFCEKYMGSTYPVKSNIIDPISSQDFEDLREILVPLVIGILAEAPDQLVDALVSLGIDKPTAKSITDLIEHFNTYPPSVREKAITAILDGLTFENGDFAFHIENMNLPDIILNTLPVVLETALLHPGDLMRLLSKPVATWAAENADELICVALGATIITLIFPQIVAPILAAIAVVGSVVVTIGMIIAAVILIIDVVIRIAQALVWLGGLIIDGIVLAFNAIKKAIQSIGKWIKNWWNRKGIAYAAANPLIKADTGKLREYAARITSINNRLGRLDSSLKEVFWEVSLADMWRFAWINTLTSASPTLYDVRSYLNNTADRLEAAENKARGYIGG